MNNGLNERRTQQSLLSRIDPITEDQREDAIRCVRRNAGPNSDDLLEMMGLLAMVEP